MNVWVEWVAFHHFKTWQIRKKSGKLEALVRLWDSWFAAAASPLASLTYIAKMWQKWQRFWRLYFLPPSLTLMPVYMIHTESSMLVSKTNASKLVWTPCNKYKFYTTNLSISENMGSLHYIKTWKIVKTSGWTWSLGEILRLLDSQLCCFPKFLCSLPLLTLQKCCNSGSDPGTFYWCHLWWHCCLYIWFFLGGYTRVSSTSPHRQS